MDGSRGEKREVNPPTVYRPEAVGAATSTVPRWLLFSSQSTQSQLFLVHLCSTSTSLPNIFEQMAEMFLLKVKNPHKQDHFQQVFLSVRRRLSGRKRAISPL